MNIRCCISGPDGDWEPGAADLDTPFMLGPGAAHPQMTVGDFFEAVKSFLTADEVIREPFSPAYGEEVPLPFQDAGEEWLIRMEKHGAFYHIASVEGGCPGSRRRFAVVSALEETGKRFLKDDVRNIGRLLEKRDGGDLPVAYWMAEIPSSYGEGKPGWLMVLSEWLEDYHEWHHTLGEGTSHIVIWDRVGGGRRADEAEYAAIYRGVSRLLALHYNPVTFERIDLWHHAAGDFVVSRFGDDLRVRLTTVRRYEPMPFFAGESGVDPRIPLVYLFLESALKTRCDRHDGTGEVAWAEDDVLGPTLDGFCLGLKEKEADRDGIPESAGHLLELLKQFSAEELLQVHSSLLQLYEREDPEELRMMQIRLPEHCRALFRTIQSASLRGFQVADRAQPAGRPTGRP